MHCHSRVLIRLQKTSLIHLIHLLLYNICVLLRLWALLHYICRILASLVPRGTSEVLPLASHFCLGWVTRKTLINTFVHHSDKNRCQAHDKCTSRGCHSCSISMEVSWNSLEAVWKSVCRSPECLYFLCLAGETITTSMQWIPDK